VVSRFFAARPPASPAAASQSPSAARQARLPSNGTRGKRVVIPARLLDAAKQAGGALEAFRAVARKKNAHTEHSDAAEAVLIPFRPFARAKTDAAKAARDGDVRLVVAGALPSTAETRPPRDVNTQTTRVPRDVSVGTPREDVPGVAESGAVLFAALTELERLHVNASCRVRQRAPAVAEARARLTALRRECRDAFRVLDARGFERAMRDRARRKRNLPAARDAREFARRGAADSIAEVRDRCALMRDTGSPHHLCVHLCYYREYDAARRMFVLRTRLAAATGSAAALDGWRAELRAATAEEMGAADGRAGDGEAAADEPDEPDEPDDEPDDERADFRTDPLVEKDEGGLFDAFRSPTPSPGSSPSSTPAVAKRRDAAGTKRRRGARGDVGESSRAKGMKKRKTKRDSMAREGAESGWLSARSLPWRVAFVSPEGDRFENPADVLERLGCRDPTVAAAAAAGGGGLGAETEADFDGFEGAAADAAGALARARRDPAGARAEGRVPPPRRRAALNLGVGGSHGGSGVRLARPDERGLDEAADVLRAALWPPELDDAMCTDPVRERREAARAGAPRSPVRMAPPYDDMDHELFKEDEQTAARIDRRWSPPRSPFGLLEEILWADEWKMLVACMMLNCTTRVQVDRVLWRLFATTPTARAAVALGREGPRTASRGAADDEKDADGFSVAGASLLEAILAPLGLHRKRARAFVRLSEDYLRARLEGEEEDRERDSRATRDGSKRSSLSPQKVSTLHGVGAYASDAHALFCENVLGVAPRDHALRWWYAWAIERREGERRKAAERRRAGKE
jgi:methyl-CpG-binding domain protein 4